MAQATGSPDAFPGAPGVPGGVPSADKAPIRFSITPGGKAVVKNGVMSPPEAFPGMPGSQPGGGDGAGGTEGNLTITDSVTPGSPVKLGGGLFTLPAPNAFPGGDQIPPGAPDTTGTTGPRRLHTPDGMPGGY